MTQIQVLEVCDECGNADATVQDRPCGYNEELNGNSESIEHVCDTCESKHLLEI